MRTVGASAAPTTLSWTGALCRAGTRPQLAAALQQMAAAGSNRQQWAGEVQSLSISPAAGSYIRVAAGGEAAGCSNWGMFFKIYLCKKLVVAWIGTLLSSGN